MIRQANTTDLTAIRTCAQRAYGRYVAAIGRPPAPMGADFAALIEAGQVQVYVAAGGEVVGFIVFYPSADHMLLESVAVQPEAAGQGIGKALIRHCEDAARRQGLCAVRLYTNEKMTDNLAIYPRLGYREVGRREEDGFRRVFFEKSLG
ncbi:GNAT family N-acetyltransferase [Pseudomonas sp. GD03944]|uniref:GNAT family N-acetyltransferase n=1 Tax=Pseudomonas sp. GD03944 TaxID=2975409 RepID=UPI00244D078A|nr:GNAT family N-acetyltransferase [Pseudomonas sp. GD03944]MDH1262082.1 GNAT family N-acetyltransferase [Pseudomonas sp. GD03944]